MTSYFKSLKKKDVAYRRKFVFVGTAAAAVLIFGTWVPLRVAQWKSNTGGGIVAGIQKMRETPTPSPSPTVEVPTADPLSFMLGSSPTPSETPESSLFESPEAETESPSNFPSL